nr:unnamed protein product [Digitaria exilis]
MDAACDRLLPPTPSTRIVFVSVTLLRRLHHRPPSSSRLLPPPPLNQGSITVWLRWRCPRSLVVYPTTIARYHDAWSLLYSHWEEPPIPNPKRWQRWRRRAHSLTGESHARCRVIAQGYRVLDEERHAVDYRPSVWGDYFIKNPTLPHAHEMIAMPMRLQEVDKRSEQSCRCAPQKLDRSSTPRVQSLDEGVASEACSSGEFYALQMIAVLMHLQEVDKRSEQSRGCAPQKFDRSSTPGVQSLDEGNAGTEKNKSTTQQWNLRVLFMEDNGGRPPL